MKLLLDTHVLLWAASSPDKISKIARNLIESKDNTLFFSAASLWEIIIKNSLGRADFKVDARLLRRGLLGNGYRELPISSEHSLAIESLPLHHKDPFDRMLVAQAIVEGFTLLTADTTLAQYEGKIQII